MREIMLMWLSKLRGEKARAQNCQGEAKRTIVPGSDGKKKKKPTKKKVEDTEKPRASWKEETWIEQAKKTGVRGLDGSFRFMFC